MVSAISISSLFGNKTTEQARKNFIPSIFIKHNAKDRLAEEFKTTGVTNDQSQEQMLKNIDKDIKPHPFKYSDTTGLYKKFGPVTGVVDKYTDFILGPGFFVKSEDSRASEIINQHITEFCLYNVMNEVIRLALPTGTLGLEMKKDSGTGIPDGYKIIPPETFFIKENEKGTVTGYAQILGTNNKTVIDLKLDDVAVFTINKMGTYGMGIIYPAMTSINNMMRSSKDLHELQSRKANSPVWWKLGGVVEGELIEPGAGDITNFGSELEYMNNKTEFCTGPLVEAKVIDYGNIGEKFGFILEYDWKMFYTAVQVPQVLLGDGNIAAGLADVQLDAFERRVVWGLPSNLEKNKQLDRFAALLTNPLLSFELRDKLEEQIAKILEFDIDFESMKEEREREEEDQKQPIVPGQQKQPQKQVVKPIKKESVCEHKGCTCEELYDIDEELKEDYSIEEWIGFSYADYKDEINKAIATDDFSDVLARTTPEIAAGKLTETQVMALKSVLQDGINNDWTMKEIADDIKKRVKPRTLYKLKE